MKKCINLFFVIACLLILRIAVLAQEEQITTAANPTPRWVSEKGFWVV
jgi:hypothetical protein